MSADPASPIEDAPPGVSAPAVEEALAAATGPARPPQGAWPDGSQEDARKTWRHMIGGGLVMVALAGLWIGLYASTPPAGREGRPGVTAPAVQPLRTSTAATRAVPPPSAAPDALSGVVTRSRPDAPHAEQMQLCGNVWVPQRADGSPAGDTIDSVPSLRAARDRIVDAMRNDPDPYAQAVAMWLGGGPGTVDEASGDQPSTGGQAGPAELAGLAVRSSDPRVYALGYAACGRAPRQGSCALLSAAQLARLDPDNGYAWLRVAGEAREQNDRAAIDDAIYRLSVAARYQSGLYQPPQVVIRHAGQDDASTVAAWTLVTQAIAMEAAFAESYDVLLGSCRVRIEDDPNRWQTCSAAASALAERSDTLLARAMGLAMGRHLGWPLERQDRLAGERVRWMSALPASGDPQLKAASCDGLRKTLARIMSDGRGSEIGALQVALAASAVSVEELVRLGREERESREQAMRRPAAASERGSAASAAGIAERAAAASAPAVDAVASLPPEPANGALPPQ